jgi:hypothetical protein
MIDPSPVRLDDAAVMGRDGRLDQIAAETPKTRERAILVDAGDPAVADDVPTRIAASFRVSLIAPLRLLADWH